MIAFLLIILGALTVTGIINRTRAVLAGRRGYRFFQPLYNVCVLLGKASVYSSTSTVVTKIFAPLYLASLLLASTMLPLGRSFPGLLNFQGDIIVFCLLFTLSRLAMIFAAFDSGSSFQAMGASRESLFSMFVEPALFLLIATLSMMTGNYSFTAIFAEFDNVSLYVLILSIVVGYGLFKLSLAECGRVPVDDSRTHLELTMIHEVMILDISGVDLAFVQIGGWLKLSIFTLFITNSLVPAQVGGWRLLVLYVAVLVLYSVTVGVIESFWARNRMNKNATYIVAISAVGLLAFVVAVIVNSGLV